MKKLIVLIMLFLFSLSVNSLGAVGATVAVIAATNANNQKNQRNSILKVDFEGKRYKVICFDTYNKDIWVFDKLTKTIVRTDLKYRYVKGTSFFDEIDSEYNVIIKDIFGVIK